MTKFHNPLPDGAQAPLLSPRESTGVLLRVVLYILVIVGYAQGMLWDAQRGMDASLKFSEWSFTEITQSGILALTVIGLLAVRRYFGLFRVGLMVMAMFALSALLRENDALMDDLISHGFWKWPVALVALPTLYYLLHHRYRLFVEMRLYFTSMPFGLFLAGFLSTFVFSRLLGRGKMWQAAMGDDYMRIVKDMVEECSESIGYLLILFSVIELYFFAQRLRRHYG
ncbi:hypothetical protein [Halotalea alkalilenta]|uniref:hypothetical protein n=1 Tax=Halotalea alkalilenta TaxID=376489 RepID=UPI00123799A5|nr:hypothetical protein [Halotalea alkalilenta]